MELLGAGFKGFNTVIQGPRVVTEADVADKGEEAPGRLAALVSRRKVGSEDAQCLADGTAKG
jgi:hypothetical protein